MMIVYFTEVYPSHYIWDLDQYGSFEIEGQLKSGKHVHIYAPPDPDLRNLEKKEVECLLWAFVGRDTVFRSERERNIPAHTVFFGNFIKNYPVPPKLENFSIQKEMSALETDDGTFLFDQKCIKNVITEDDKHFGLLVMIWYLLDYIYNE